MRTNRLVLLSLTAAATATLVACTECAETDTDQSVTGALTYTESAAAQAARERRIVDLPKNVTVWERTDDTKVGIARQVDMRDTFSVYVSHYSAAGNMCVQGANLRGSLCFDQPTRDGTFSLASLKAKVCENYRVRVGFAEANDAGTPDAPKIGDAGDAGDAGKKGSGTGTGSGTGSPGTNTGNNGGYDDGRGYPSSSSGEAQQPVTTATPRKSTSSGCSTAPNSTGSFGFAAMLGLSVLLAGRKKRK